MKTNKVTNSSSTPTVQSRRWLRECEHISTFSTARPLWL